MYVFAAEAAILLLHTPTQNALHTQPEPHTTSAPSHPATPHACYRPTVTKTHKKHNTSNCQNSCRHGYKYITGLHMRCHGTTVYCRCPPLGALQQTGIFPLRPRSRVLSFNLSPWRCAQLLCVSCCSAHTAAHSSSRGRHGCHCRTSYAVRGEVFEPSACAIKAQKPFMCRSYLANINVLHLQTVGCRDTVIKYISR